MIHLIWRGKGYWVFVITFGCSLVANLLTNGISGDDIFWRAHRWPLAISLLVSALLCSALAMRLAGLKRRVLIDQATREEVVLEDHHDFFFVPVKLWGPLLALIAVVLLVQEFVIRRPN